MEIHLQKQDIVDMVRRLANPYIHVVEQSGVYYIACEKPNVDYSCQEVYEVILTWVIQVNTESIDFRYNPLWFGYAPEETVRKLYEDLIRLNRLMGKAKQHSEYTLVVPPPLPDEYLKKVIEEAKAKPIVQYEIPLESDCDDTGRISHMITKEVKNEYDTE